MESSKQALEKLPEEWREAIEQLIEAKVEERVAKLKEELQSKKI